MFVCGHVHTGIWPLLRLLILLNLIWWQVSNLSKISRIVLPWIQRSIDSHFGWNHWSIICLSKVSSWVSNVSKEWIWHAKSWISGPGVWSISRNAEICLKLGISSDTCMLLYKCIYTLTIVTSNAVLCSNMFYCTGYWQPPVTGWNKYSVIIPRHLGPGTHAVFWKGVRFFKKLLFWGLNWGC